jgi:nitrite reductase/ring-hydroxylating ferredoxin subunit
MVFDLRTGRMRGEVGLAVRVYPVRVEGDAVSVDLAELPAIAPQASGSDS